MKALLSNCTFDRGNLTPAYNQRYRLFAKGAVTESGPTAGTVQHEHLYNLRLRRNRSGVEMKKLIPWILFALSVTAALYLFVLLLNAGSALDDRTSSVARLRERGDLALAVIRRDWVGKDMASLPLSPGSLRSVA